MPCIGDQSFVQSLDENSVWRSAFITCLKISTLLGFSFCSAFTISYVNVCAETSPTFGCTMVDSFFGTLHTILNWEMTIWQSEYKHYSSFEVIVFFWKYWKSWNLYMLIKHGREILCKQNINHFLFHFPIDSVTYKQGKYTIMQYKNSCEMKLLRNCLRSYQDARFDIIIFEGIYWIPIFKYQTFVNNLIFWELIIELSFILLK